LPGRRNVVLSSSLDPAKAGVDVARSVEDVLATGENLWVIGGGAVYAAFLPHADQVVVTEVDVRPAGDTVAPELGPEWRPGHRVPESGWAESSGGMRFRVWLWQRPGAAPGPVPVVLAEQHATWAGREASGDAPGR
jgi:dihydrofolate reductase